MVISFSLLAKAEIDSFRCGIELHRIGSRRRLYEYLSSGLHEGQDSQNKEYQGLFHRRAQCKLLVKVHEGNKLHLIC